MFVVINISTCDFQEVSNYDEGIALIDRLCEESHQTGCYYTQDDFCIMDAEEFNEFMEESE